jgi:nitrite reductase/ring-hydroxylating ferredoxin subunit
LKRLCSSAELPPGGSIRFPLDPQRRYADEGFAHRAPDGTVRAWVNVCPHRAQPIDLGDGRLFNAAGEIECQAHGARFDPATGNCRGGPCTGNELRPLAIEEVEGEIRAATEAA